MPGRPASSARRRNPPHAREFADALADGGVADSLYKSTARLHPWAQNVVTKVRLTSAVDLRRFSAKRFFSYVPSQFLATAYRIRDQLPATELVFRTGRAVVVGTHSLPQTYQAAHRLRLSLAEEGYPTTFEEFSNVNMVWNTRVDAEFGIDLAAIYKNNQDKTEWVPPMFPGLKFAMDDEHVKLRIFPTKAVVVMGATRPGRIDSIFHKVTEMAHRNPDPNLPGSDKRFEYLKEKKRLAFRELVSSAAAEDADEDGDGGAQ